MNRLRQHLNFSFMPGKKSESKFMNWLTLHLSLSTFIYDYARTVLSCRVISQMPQTKRRRQVPCLLPEATFYMLHHSGKKLKQNLQNFPSNTEALHSHFLPKRRPFISIRHECLINSVLGLPLCPGKCRALGRLQTLPL